MTSRRAIAWAAGLALALAPPAAAAGPDPTHEDEQTLAAAQVSSTGAGLLEFFRKHTPVEAEPVADAVRATLVALARPGGRPDPALLAALEDRVPDRRAAAVQALIRSAPPAERRPLRRYLHDAEPLVRLEAALALAAARDR